MDVAILVGLGGQGSIPKGPIENPPFLFQQDPAQPHRTLRDSGNYKLAMFLVNRDRDSFGMSFAQINT